jgi:hypothetical protein
VITVSIRENQMRKPASEEIWERSQAWKLPKNMKGKFRHLSIGIEAI